MVLFHKFSVKKDLRNKNLMFFCDFLYNFGFPIKGRLTSIVCYAAIVKSTVM
jgi:hypothetical protein